MNHIKVGLQKQPHSTLLHHVEAIANLIPCPDIVPSMTDKDIRFAQGQQNVVAYIRERSANAPHEVFDTTLVNSWFSSYPPQEFDWETPVAKIMFHAGIHAALETIKRYHDEELNNG